MLHIYEFLRIVCIDTCIYLGQKKGLFCLLFLLFPKLYLEKCTVTCFLYCFPCYVRRLPQPSWLVSSSHPDQLLCLANEQSLTVATFNLSQEEFVGKVT